MNSTTVLDTHTQNASHPARSDAGLATSTIGLPDFNSDPSTGLKNREIVVVVITTMTGSFIVFAMFVFFLKLNKSREKKGQVLDEEMVESRTDTNQVELNGAYQIYEEKF